MSVQKWATPESLTTVISTNMNSMTNGNIVYTDNPIDNLTDLYQYMAVELTLASLTPTGAPYLNLYIQQAMDGSNYEYITPSSGQQVVGVFTFSTATSDKRSALANILIPPGLFKLAIENRTGVTLASSGNLLKMRRYNQQVV